MTYQIELLNHNGRWSVIGEEGNEDSARSVLATYGRMFHRATFRIVARSRSTAFSKVLAYA